MFTEHFRTLQVVQKRYGDYVVGSVISEVLLAHQVTSVAATHELAVDTRKF